MAAGRKTGGRQKGTPNRATAQRVAEIEESGLTPLDFLLSILRDVGAEQSVRIDAAKAAAPYVHPRLSTVDVGNKNDEPFQMEGRWASNPAEATHDPANS